MIGNATRHHGIRLINVAAIPRSKKLYVTWDSGEEAILDYEPLIARYQSLKPLEDDTLFQNVEVEAHGWRIRWNDAIDGGADSLRQLAEEQISVIHRRKAG